MSHGGRVSSIEDNVPERISDSVTPGHSLRAVVVKMSLFNMSEIPVLKVVVVLAMVNPFFQDVALNDAG